MRVLTCWKISKLCSDLQKLLKRQRWSYHPWPKQILGQFPQLSLNVASFLFSIFSNILFVLLSVCLLLQLLRMVPSILRQLLPGLNLRSCAQISLTGVYCGYVYSFCYGLGQNSDVLNYQDWMFLMLLLYAGYDPIEPKNQVWLTSVVNDISGWRPPWTMPSGMRSCNSKT